MCTQIMQYKMIEEMKTVLILNVNVNMHFFTSQDYYLLMLRNIIQFLV